VATLFVADVHLDPDRRPAIHALFLAFLRTQAREADAVYLLGDLFDAWWLGDRIDREHYPAALSALRELTAQGVPVYAVHGNRDFLLGEEFSAATGVTLLNEPSVVEVNGESILIAHGDVYCTDDVRYQRLRRLTRNPVLQWLWKHTPIRWRRHLGQKIRNASAQAIQYKPAAIMDVHPATVDRAMVQAGVQRLVHGHTHRPNHHQWQHNGQTFHRHVVGDWYQNGSVLVAHQGEWTLETLST
jgi:UDP-2,3-diacylglucosamine hydrolase